MSESALAASFHFPMQNPSTGDCLTKPLRPTVNLAEEGSLAGRWLSGWPLIGVAVVCYWLLFFSEIRGEWHVNPQYNYGYVVPLLGAFLFWRRWPGRPVANPGRAFFAPLMMAVLLIGVLPLTVVFEANPEWRLLYWISGAEILAVTVCVLHWLGGPRWAGYFAPPLLFLLVALPWPVELEQGAIQGLMRLVAELTVNVVNVLGIPALQHGNLIEVSSGVVGIDEACSGVRSLQSSLMLSLFLGEMNRWSWLRRAALVGASMLFVVAANLVRTTFLVWAAVRRGIPQMEAWHDTAGLLIMFIVLPGLLGLSYLMQPRKTVPDASPSPSKHSAFRPVPRWVGLAMILWIAVIEVGVEAWYRVHEKTLVTNVGWSMAWPAGAPQFQKTELPENSRIILRCDNSQSAAWKDDLGNDWTGFVLQWNPGRNSAQLAKGHRPDICFPAAGAKLAGDFGQVEVAADGVDLKFHYQSFTSGNKLLHVFYCLWSDKISPRDTNQTDDSSRQGRIQAAWVGQRNLGQKVLEIVISGPETSEDAIALLKSQVKALIRKS